MFDRTSIQIGMTVRSADGEKLGRVFGVAGTEFEIEKGIFFPKDYLCRYEDILDVQRHDIILRHGQADLRRLSASRFSAAGTEASDVSGTAGDGTTHAAP